jgi:two-component system, cell cycle sensor histidine kinase and response regulator CckA
MTNGLKTVLVIDDDPGFQKSFSQKLKMMGFSVSVADTGSKAVETFSQNPGYFDLVVLDMLMPDLDGTDIYELIKIKNPDVRILFTSGVFDFDYLKNILQYGNIGFVIKPFNHDELQIQINKVMNCAT